jgi:aromatic-L-amino-acid decarboxylase
MTLRDLGAQGIRDVLSRHLELAQRFAGWIDAHPDFERVAPVPFSVVCFRAHPPGTSDGPALDALNERLLDEVNASGEVFLSHTRLHGGFVLRLAIGHLRTTDVHVSQAWEILQRALASQAGLLPR